MRGYTRKVFLTFAFCLFSFKSVFSNCDSVDVSVEEPPPPLPQYGQSCHGPFPVLLKVELGHKFAGLEGVLRVEPASLQVAR